MKSDPPHIYSSPLFNLIPAYQDEVYSKLSPNQGTLHCLPSTANKTHELREVSDYIQQVICIVEKTLGGGAHRNRAQLNFTSLVLSLPHSPHTLTDLPLSHNTQELQGINTVYRPRGWSYFVPNGFMIRHTKQQLLHCFYCCSGALIPEIVGTCVKDWSLTSGK